MNIKMMNAIAKTAKAISTQEMNASTVMEASTRFMIARTVEAL